MRRVMVAGAAGVIGLLLDAGAGAAVPPPGFVVPGSVVVRDLDGVTDDLLTAGLGAEGIASATLPTIADPAAPTPDELRRRAVHNAWRGLIDTSPGGGWTVLFGPNLGPGYTDRGGKGLVAGREYLMQTDDGAGGGLQTVLVQIPADFDRQRPCLVTGPSSGSRNVYGAVGTTAEWAFRNRCAIAHTDKGTGNAYHDLTRGTVYDRLGRLRPANGAEAPNFRAPDRDGLAAWIDANPDRLAYKQAHSGKNVDSRWGFYTLQAIRAGLWALNDHLGTGTESITPANTLVIAAGVSNGGGAAIQAAETDRDGLIDAVVTVIPNVIPAPRDGMVIRYGGEPVTDPGRHFIDYYTQLALYADCAALAPALAGAPFQDREPNGGGAGQTLRANRCASLKDKGLLTATDTAAQAAEALERITAHGVLRESLFTLPFMAWAGGYRQIIGTYPQGYGRFLVQENPCGTSFAATGPDGRPAPLPGAAAALLFAAGNILPPSGGIAVIADRAENGPVAEPMAVSRSTGRADLNLDSALCWRALVTGEGGGQDGRGQGDAGRRVRQGMAEVTSGGDLHGLPALLVAARDDQVIHPNHAGRAYSALNALVEGPRSRLSYIEVTNTQHFESLIPAFKRDGGPAYLPIQHYYARALDAMLAHLRDGTPLPPSQVVRTTPRGATALTTENFTTFLPPITAQPAAADAITADKTGLSVPR
ncbi:D-(-)-3-hydroxybutyrate oligomer hydrolase [Azospirillum sp. RWY-5-1]|uniref:D-(-)-3-hydroxybutyrate oligomer hydrolase n=1 Tax=Azospirillum oleiclasticum TaxID=2735135 RepID=A0ABX2TAP1_9PROT|nr:3-hydroxybutyrate oligomer hydrolase family protein [Azospirillum oleiclasticum]NYZ15323.1 D-(-)-3-hydroxybutyrate oligomer hydrolase [Azospirillum oleiclasticum]NYZ21256.1 D-(-)-3-hydroxybutyrate oligomer hydrolase [Azospirillum oleiclasticum]